MEKIISWLALVLFLSLVTLIVLFLNSQPSSIAKEALLMNGTVVTMDFESQGNAVHIRDGKIIAVGEADELLSTLSKTAGIVDLNGATLLPGFIEPHTHPIATAMLGETIDVSGFSHENREQVIATLRENIGRSALTSWDIAFGWDPVMIEDLTAPTLAELDALAPERPLVILTQMMHDAYANSLALEAAGITVNTSNPTGGEFVKDQQGQLTGTVREVSAINALLKALPALPKSISSLLVNRQFGKYAEQGITTVGVPGPVGRVENPLELFQTLSALPSPPVRTVVYGLPSQLENLTPAATNSFTALRGVKFWMDGSPFTGGAAWQEPYENNWLTNTRLHLSENHTATLNYQKNDFNRLFQSYHQRGFQIAVHVQGERAIDRVLDVAEQTLKQYPRKDHRHRLEHNALITKQQIVRAESLGITLSFFIDHIWFYGDKLPLLIGNERTERYMPLATAMKSSLPVSLHGDSPATPLQPLRTVQTAVTRSTSGGRVIAPEETVTVHQALQAITINAAWQLGQEDTIGSIAPGKNADFVVLSDNPLQVPSNTIDSINVLETWIDGQRVNSGWWTRGQLQLITDLVF